LIFLESCPNPVIIPQDIKTIDAYGCEYSHKNTVQWPRNNTVVINIGGGNPCDKPVGETEGDKDE